MVCLEVNPELWELAHYLTIVDLQGVELVWVFCEVGGAPGVACLLFINPQEVVHGRVFIMELVKLVAPNSGAHSAP